MNETDERDNEIERFLKQARPAEPRDELKARVLGAAREAWAIQPSAVLWRIALRRVAVSAAAAVVMAALANIWSDSTVAGLRSARPGSIAVESQDLTDAEFPYHHLIRHMAVARKPAQANAPTLLDYVQKLHDTLSQTEQNGTSTIEAPVERRSRLPGLSDRYCS